MSDKKHSVELHLNTEIYTTIDEQDNELKTSPSYDVMSRWADRHDYTISKIVVLDDNKYEIANSNT